MSERNQSIVLGGGCFWCLEAAYQQLSGVVEVVSGYSGGDVPDPSYEAVCSGTTGHVEVVKVVFDPSVILLKEILAVFWMMHDPTSLNRQGADVGSQYASVIFYTDDVQYEVVVASRDEAQHQLDERIMTRIEKLGEFYEAEEYHKDYYINNSNTGYCTAVIEPKLAKLRQHFAPLLTSA